MGWIIWITGNSKSGKTTLARQMKGTDGKIVILDGDEIRAEYPDGWGFSKKDRWEHNLNVATRAVQWTRDGYNVIVAVICPYTKLREEVQEITNCSFIYLSGGMMRDDYPYEYESDKFYFKKDVQERV